jgi:hypothetical protein
MGAPLVGLCAEKWFGFQGSSATAGCEATTSESGEVRLEPRLLSVCPRRLLAWMGCCCFE